MPRTLTEIFVLRAGKPPRFVTIFRANVEGARKGAIGLETALRLFGNAGMVMGGAPTDRPRMIPFNEEMFNKAGGLGWWTHQGSNLGPAD